MISGESFPILSVADLSRSLAFWRDVLGGEVTYAFPEDAPGFVTLRLGTGQLGLGATSGGVAGAGAGVALCAYVEDCDAAVAAVRAAGHRVREEPADQPWGERVARVLDPDGFEVLLVAPLTA